MFWWPPLDVSTGGGAGGAGVGPQVNKVFSDDHQMSIMGRRVGLQVWCPGERRDGGSRSPGLMFEAAGGYPAM